MSPADSSAGSRQTPEAGGVVPYPDRLRRAGVGWASALRVPVCPLGRFVRGAERRLDDPALQPDGLTLILPGIQGRSFAEYDLALGLAAGGVRGRIAVFDWTTGWFVRCLEHLRRRDLHDAGGRALAARVVHHRHRFPAAPLTVIGYSGGASVTLNGLAHLPPGVTVTRAVLLAAACSPAVDAAALVGRCDRGIDSFESRLDWPVLAAFLTAFGTTDGKRRPAAGWSGFDAGGPGFRAHRWRPGWARSFHHGGHFGAVNRVFAAEVLAPLITFPSSGGRQPSVGPAS